ncbi:hypothetical protein BLA29_014842, partial [Euroglyphus maynei]
ILSRYNLKPSSENPVDANNVKNKSNLIPKFDDFVAKRDYVGILTLIEFVYDESKIPHSVILDPIRMIW